MQITQSPLVWAGLVMVGIGTRKAGGSLGLFALYAELLGLWSQIFLNYKMKTYLFYYIDIISQ